MTDLHKNKNTNTPPPLIKHIIRSGLVGLGLIIIGVIGYIAYNQQELAITKSIKDGLITARSALFTSSKNDEAYITQKIDGILDIEQIKTDKGLVAWLTQDHSVPVISIEFAFQNAGSAQDPASKSGLARLTASLLDEGAGQWDSLNFQQKLQEYAIQLGFSVNRDAFLGSLKTLSAQENLDQAIALLSAALYQPRFDDEAIDRMKNTHIALLRNYLSNPSWRALRLAYEYGYAGHSYARNSGGSITDLTNIDANDMRKFMARAMKTGQLRIAISGDVTPSKAAQIIDKIFGKLNADSQDLTSNASSNKMRILRDIDLQNKGQHIHHPMNIPQTIIQMWHPAISQYNPNYAKAVIFSHIFGEGGFGSRLMDQAREKQGLTYGIYSHHQHLSHSNLFTISTSTRNETAQDMFDVIRDQLAKINQSGISQDELDNAKSYITGALPLQFTSNPTIAKTLLSIQLDDLPMNYLDSYINDIKAVSLNDMQDFIKTYLNWDQFMVITAGTPENITMPAITQQIDKIPNIQ